MKRYADAASVLEEAYSIFSESLGDEHKRTKNLIPHLVSCYDAWHEAEPDAGHDKKAQYWREKLEAVEKAKSKKKD